MEGTKGVVYTRERERSAQHAVAICGHGRTLVEEEAKAKADAEERQS
jgi:hypothetical protein